MTVLHVRTGRIDTQDEFHEWFDRLEPEFSVLEPAIVMRAGGQRGATPGFQGLVAGRIDLGESRIAELRLDWNEGSLLFVADGEGFLWSSHSIRNGFPPSASRGEASAPLADLVEAREQAFWRTTGELTRFAREGEQLQGGPPAQVIRFQRGPNLVAWWFQRPTEEPTGALRIMGERLVSWFQRSRGEAT